MAGWVVPALMAAGLALQLYNTTKSNSGFAPAATPSGQQQQPFQVPDVYGQTTGGYSLLGRKPLSQSIASGYQPTAPSYGSRGMSMYDQYAMSQELGRGK